MVSGCRRSWAPALAGAGFIVALDTEREKVELARSLGAQAAVRVLPDDPAGTLALVRATLDRAGYGGEVGADHVFECIGRPATVELAVDLARAGGTITLVGMPAQGERAGIDVYRFVEDGKRLLGSTYGSSVPADRLPAPGSPAPRGPPADRPPDHGAHRPGRRRGRLRGHAPRADGARRVVIHDWRQ